MAYFLTYGTGAYITGQTWDKSLTKPSILAISLALILSSNLAVSRAIAQMNVVLRNRRSEVQILYSAPILSVFMRLWEDNQNPPALSGIKTRIKIFKDQHYLNNLA